MSNQPEQENQQTATPQEMRQALLAELEAGEQAIAELSDEQLEEVAGGGGGLKFFKNFSEKTKDRLAIAGGVGALLSIPALAIGAAHNGWMGVGKPGTGPRDERK